MDRFRRIGGWLLLALAASVYLGCRAGRLGPVDESARESSAAAPVTTTNVEAPAAIVTTPAAAKPQEADIAWGEAVNGLQAGLEARRNRFAEGEPADLVIHTRNVGDTAFVLSDVDFGRSWRIEFVSDDGEVRRARRVQPYLKIKPVLVQVDPGVVREAAVSALPRGFELVGESGPAVMTLPPGRYEVRATYTGRWGRRRPDDVPRYWEGTVAVGKVEIEITPRPSSP